MRRIVDFVNSVRGNHLFVVAINGAIGNYRGNCYSKPNCYHYLYSNRHDGRVQRHRNPDSHCECCVRHQRGA